MASQLVTRWCVNPLDDVLNWIYYTPQWMKVRPYENFLSACVFGPTSTIQWRLRHGKIESHFSLMKTITKTWPSDALIETTPDGLKSMFFKALNFINHSECSANANEAVCDLKCHRKIRNSLEKCGCCVHHATFGCFHVKNVYCTFTPPQNSGQLLTVLFFPCFHGGVVPDDGYDNLIWGDTEIWTSRKEDVNPSVNPYTI